MQKYGDSLWSAKVEVERYFQGVKASYYKACGEYQMVSGKGASVCNDDGLTPNWQ